MAVGAADLLRHEVSLGVDAATRAFGHTAAQRQRGSEFGPGFHVDTAAVARAEQFDTCSRLASPHQVVRTKGKFNHP